MFVRVVVEVAVVNRALVSWVLIPFATMAAAALVAALVLWRATAKAGRRGKAEVPLKNPFSLTSAIKFALLFTAVLLVVKLVQQRFPGEGVYVVAALAGLTDVDAITLSMAAYARESGASGTAATAIAIAAVANTLVKAGMAAVLGSAALRSRVLVAAGGVLAAGAAALILAGAARG
jgi:uncharacterized membrane protein (DUF4010 family)